MKIDVLESAKLSEKVYKTVHEKSGLTVYVMPKADFTKSYASFSTHFGSVNSKFLDNETGEEYVVPDGTAHFLEHKMFEQPDGSNAFEQYSKTGASANAFTSFNNTSYIFSATDNFYESLEILLDFVSKPYFTDENVAKEQGIIAQEIKMYDDEPNWCVYFNLICAMYNNHPVKQSIAGTVETIAEIDKDVLYKCYNTFYNPSNMSLFVCGNVEIEKVMEVVDKIITTPAQDKIKNIFPKEPDEVAKKYTEQIFPISAPFFMLGFKDTDVGYDGKELLKKELATEIILDIVVGKSSKLYNELYEQGLINNTFEYEYSGEKDYGYSIIGGETPDPERVKNAILNSFKNTKITDEQFERAKRSAYGRYIRLFNNVENVSNTFVSYLFKNINLFDYEEVYKELTKEYIQNRFEKHFNEKNSALSVVKNV